MLLILALLIGVPLLVVALFLVLVFLTPPYDPKPLPDVDVEQIENRIEYLRQEQQATLEQAAADPQSKQWYENYLRERERVDPKP